MKRSSEKESKLVCTRVLTEADICRMLEGLELKVNWLSTSRQIDTYFDTGDGILLQSGFSPRARRIGKTSVGTLKTPISNEGAFTNRDEIKWQIIRPNRTQSADGRVVNLLCTPPKVNRLLQRLGVQAAAPVLTVATIRHKGEAVARGGFLVELALDEVTFIGPRGEAKQNELELEHKAGNIRRLKWIERSLIAKHGFEPSRSKFKVGMEKVG